MTTEQVNAGRVLLAVLANPTLSTESRSIGRVRLAARILGFEGVRVVNLFALASPSSRDIAVLGQDAAGWESARPSLADGVLDCEGVLMGFGTIPVTGVARHHFGQQLDWFAGQLRESGHQEVWQVGDARHPSRWHQYVSDRHGRTSGGSFEERLREVLTSTSLSVLPWAAVREPVQRA